MAQTTRDRPRPGPTPRPRDATRGRAPVRPRSEHARRSEISDSPADSAGSRLQRRWIIVGLVIVSLVVAIALLRAPFFAIAEIQLSGDSRTSIGAVRSALAISEGDALATFDTEAAEQRIAALPWVDEVELTRGWPSTLRVQIRERTPAASVGLETGAAWIVVSDDGHVLERRLTPLVGLPHIVAPTRVVDKSEIGKIAPEVTEALALATNLPLQLSPWVQSWTLGADGEVRAELVGSAGAVFGTGQDHRTQYVSLASILDGGTSLACISVIDLDIADTPVIERNAQCMAAAREM